MGRYACYGIATSYVVPLKSIEEEIQEKFFNKTLNDFKTQLPEIIKQQFPDCYDLTVYDNGYVLTLKESVTMADIIRMAKEFYRIFPKSVDYKEIDKFTDLSVEDALKSADNCRFGYVIQKFRLPYYLYYMPLKIDDRHFYTQVGVEGFLLHAGCHKIDAEDDIAPFDFLTELLRYRLKENPLSPSLLAFLSA